MCVLRSTIRSPHPPRGLQNIVVMHRLSDLSAAGAAGSREVALAEGLLHDAQTRVIYRQVEDEEDD